MQYCVIDVGKRRSLSVNAGLFQQADEPCTSFCSMSRLEVPIVSKFLIYR